MVLIIYRSCLSCFCTCPQSHRSENAIRIDIEEQAGQILPYKPAMKRHMTYSAESIKDSAPFTLDGTSLIDVEDGFELMDEWEDRYRYIIELGRKLPPLSQDAYTDDNKVRGCTSQVWLVAEKEGSGARLTFKGDSDAHIVKGLVAIMLLIFSGKTPAEILEIDARATLEKLGLRQHLSPMRANGLFSMLERIKDMARAEKTA